MPCFDIQVNVVEKVLFKVYATDLVIAKQQLLDAIGNNDYLEVTEDTYPEDEPVQLWDRKTVSVNIEKELDADWEDSLGL
jgi:hypothetical protein